MRCNPDRVWHDAVHEAGHAVIARALGLTSGYTNLSPGCGEQISGDAFIHDALQSWSWNCRHPERNGNDGAFWRGTIIARMAGAEAEREIIGSCLGRCGDDRRLPGLIRDGLGYEQPEGAVRMRRFARQLVKRHREAILRFADQLVAAAELDELVAG